MELVVVWMKRSVWSRDFSSVMYMEKFALRIGTKARQLSFLTMREFRSFWSTWRSKIVCEMIVFLFVWKHKRWWYGWSIWTDIHSSLFVFQLDYTNSNVLYSFVCRRIVLILHSYKPLFSSQMQFRSHTNIRNTPIYNHSSVAGMKLKVKHAHRTIISYSLLLLSNSFMFTPYDAEKQITNFFDPLPINKTNLTRFFTMPLLHSPIISRSHKQ